MGGPTICPWCDTGGPAVRYKHELAMLRAHDASETAALRKVRDEMAVIRMKFPGWEPESLKLQPAMVSVRSLHEWLAALDAILLEQRK